MKIQKLIGFLNGVTGQRYSLITHSTIEMDKDQADNLDRILKAHGAVLIDEYPSYYSTIEYNTRKRVYEYDGVQFTTSYRVLKDDHLELRIKETISKLQHELKELMEGKE